MNIPTVILPDGTKVPALGLGTWHMGETASRAAAEEAVLREGIERGLSLIDTAEMYADGGAEKLVGNAIKGQRERVFLVSKIMPQNASAAGVARHCEASLKRLGTDYLDLLSAALARLLSAGADHRRVRATAGGGKNSPLGRVEFRHRRYGGAFRHAAGTKLCDQPGSVSPR